MKLFLILSILTMTSLTNAQDSVLFFGHRGCRGLLPENTIESFNKAIELGVDGIEWDVVVSKDKKLVISHEPYVDGNYCLDKNGNDISTAEGKKVNFYNLTAEEIQKYDCGSKGNSKFPEQKSINTYKPTVQEAFEKIDFKSVTILFEVKSETKDYGTYQPEPKEYARIIADEIKDFEYKSNIIFMSFDAQLLEELYKILPDFRYVYLTYKPFVSIDTFLKEITFKPYALGMYYPTIRKKDVQKARNKNVKIFAWTVNDKKQSDKLINYGVSGIITDYPDRVSK